MTKLSKRSVEQIEPETKAVYLWDDQMPGFGVKVLPSGVRRYIVKYRVGGGRCGTQRWYTIGTHGPITVDQAREIAQQVLAAVARGDDPQADKFFLRDAPTMDDLWGRYEKDHLPRKKDTSARDDRQKWREVISGDIGARKVNSITREDVERLHRKFADRPYQANRILALLSKLFNMSEKWGMRAEHTNPCRHVDKFPEEARQRYLSFDELSRLGEALEGGLSSQTETPYMVAAIKLLLLTGARVSEVLTAEWAWVDWERRVINLPDSKTGRKPLFLSQPAIDILTELRRLETSKDCPYLIRGRTSEQALVNLAKPWKRLCERAKLKDVRIHDLRHTAASIGVGQGLNLPIIGRLLGHTQVSTTNRYAHVDIDPALMAADRIGSVVDMAMKGVNVREDS